ncbi:MAG: hypothetical protein AAF658_06800 [Myxococcota bacterium]
MEFPKCSTLCDAVVDYANSHGLPSEVPSNPAALKQLLDAKGARERPDALGAVTRDGRFAEFIDAVRGFGQSWLLEVADVVPVGANAALAHHPNALSATKHGARLAAAA